MSWLKRGYLVCANLQISFLLSVGTPVVIYTLGGGQGVRGRALGRWRRRRERSRFTLEGGKLTRGMAMASTRIKSGEFAKTTS